MDTYVALPYITSAQAPDRTPAAPGRNGPADARWGAPRLAAPDAEVKNPTAENDR